VPIQFHETKIPDIDIRVPSLEKAQRLLGYDCKFDMDRALSLTIDWYRRNLTALSASAGRADWSAPVKEKIERNEVLPLSVARAPMHVDG
jgi:hypothetical protein